MALGADGGILLLGRSIRDSWGTYVVRLELDGTVSWLTELGGSTASPERIQVAPSGNVVVAGNFDRSVTLGGFSLETDALEYRQHVAELDPRGQPVGLSQLQIPSVVNAPVDIKMTAVAVSGGKLVVGGLYYTLNPASHVASGYYTAEHSLDGSLVAETLFPTSVEESYAAFGPQAADLTAEGRLAIGGSFAGLVDFGDGEVDGGTGPDGEPSMKPFLAVFDAAPAADVD